MNAVNSISLNEDKAEMFNIFSYLLDDTERYLDKCFENFSFNNKEKKQVLSLFNHYYLSLNANLTAIEEQKLYENFGFRKTGKVLLQIENINVDFSVLTNKTTIYKEQLHGEPLVLMTLDNKGKVIKYEWNKATIKDVTVALENLRKVIEENLLDTYPLDVLDAKSHDVDINNVYCLRDNSYKSQNVCAQCEYFEPSFLETEDQTVVKHASFACAFRNYPVLMTSNSEDVALGNINKVALSKTDLSIAYFNRANTLFAQGKFKESINDFSEAIKLNPKFSVAFYRRGNAYSKLDNQDKAIVDYNTAINLNPKLVPSYKDRAYTYYEMNEKENAVEDLSNVLKLSSSEAQSKLSQSAILFMQGKKAEAEKVLWELIELEPHYTIVALQEDFLAKENMPCAFVTFLLYGIEQNIELFSDEQMKVVEKVKELLQYGKCRIIW